LMSSSTRKLSISCKASNSRAHLPVEPMFVHYTRSVRNSKWIGDLNIFTHFIHCITVTNYYFTKAVRNYERSGRSV
jgi:hypothetical protein